MNFKKEFQNYALNHRGISSLQMYDYQKAASKVLMPSSMFPMSMTPNIIEERQLNVVSMDVFSRLMMNRIIFLGMPIDSMVANVVNAQLLFLESVDPELEISIYLNTPGGEVYAGMGIYDLIQYIKPDVATVNTGIAASMGSILLCAGTKGKRQALRHSRTMIHQPLGGAQGQASDIEITAREIQKIKKELYDVISLHTGKDYEKIEKDADRDHWLTAEEAKEYGLIDKIIAKK